MRLFVLMKKNNTKKVFSSANFFFLCIVFIFSFIYYYNEWQRNRAINNNSASIIFFIMIIAICAYFPTRFPLFIKTKNEKIDESYYDDTYYKELDFWSQLYLGFFHWTKYNDSISLFSKKVLGLGIKNRECKFTYNNSEVKNIHRIFDFILTVISSIGVFFFAQEFSKMGVVFGLTLSVFSLLFVFRNIILNRIFSVKIGNDEEYNLSIMYPYCMLDGIMSRKYGFAYYGDNNILLQKDVFCGGEILKKYIVAHEKGHLKTSNRVKNLLQLITFIFVTILFFTSVGFMVQIGVKRIEFIILPLVIYAIFLYVYLTLIRKKSEKDEFLADVYAIKDIGKEAVLNGLEAIKKDTLYKRSGVKLSGVDIDRRIEFVKKYKG